MKFKIKWNFPSILILIYLFNAKGVVFANVILIFYFPALIFILFSCENVYDFTFYIFIHEFENSTKKNSVTFSIFSGLSFPFFRCLFKAGPNYVNFEEITLITADGEKFSLQIFVFLWNILKQYSVFFLLYEIIFTKRFCVTKVICVKIWKKI